MEIKIETVEIEEYAKRIARDKIRKQVRELINTDLEAMSNFSELKNQISRISYKLAEIERRVSGIEESTKKKGWLKK